MSVKKIGRRSEKVPLTKLLTMILESPFPAAGPLGTTALTFPLAVLVLFLTPPTGAVAVALAGLVVRRPPRPPRRAE